jgi:hypothetical protein
MATIRKEILIRASPDTFANGLVARELIVDIDDEARRLCWAAVGGRLSHHNASMQVFPDGSGGTRLVWIADLLPDALLPDIRALVEMGSAALKKTLEAGEPSRASA